MRYTVTPKDGSFAGWIVADGSFRQEIVDASISLVNHIGDRLDNFEIEASQNGWKLEKTDELSTDCDYC